MAPDETAGNALGGKPPERPGPIPAPGRPATETPKPPPPETAEAPAAMNGTAPLSIDAQTLATLVATSDQHGAEIEALAAAQRLAQRNVVLLSLIVAYLLYRSQGGRERVMEGVRDAVAGPVAP